MTTLLLDADIVAFKVASLSEERYEWDDDPTYAVDKPGARQHADELIGEYCDELKANSVLVCLTDEVNFRQQLNPGYKAQRKEQRKPELLAYVKEYLASEYQSFKRPRLEADDIMGIHATTDKWIKGDKIIVSEDKDMRTIPAKVWNPRYPDRGVLEIDELDADRFHMWQTLTGDVTDGFPGCPGIGPKSIYAEEIIGADRDELWDIVLMAYASKGRTEDDAVLQAQMARILRAEDWNNRNKKIRLWQPWFLDQ